VVHQTHGPRPDGSRRRPQRWDSLDYQWLPAAPDRLLQDLDSLEPRPSKRISELLRRTGCRHHGRQRPRRRRRREPGGQLCCEISRQGRQTRSRAASAKRTGSTRTGTTDSDRPDYTSAARRRISSRVMSWT